MRIWRLRLANPPGRIATNIQYGMPASRKDRFDARVQPANERHQPIGLELGNTFCDQFSLVLAVAAESSHSSVEWC